MKTEFEEYINTGMLGAYHPEAAVIRQTDDGDVVTIFRDTSQFGSAKDRDMIIEGRVFHVTSIFAREPPATPTQKLLTLIDTELAKESRSP